jgi:hypothetical protein
MGFGGLYLDEELEVHIVGLGGDALGPLVPPAGFEVDTLGSTAELAPVRIQDETRQDLDGAGVGMLTMAAAAAAAAVGFLVRLLLLLTSSASGSGRRVAARGWEAI